MSIVEHISALNNLVEFGFWPSLVFVAISFFIMNSYHLYSMLNKYNMNNPTKYKRDRKFFIYSFVGQLAFIAYGLYIIGGDHPALAGSLYRLFLLYYAVAIIAGICFIVTLINSNKKGRQNKNHDSEL